MSTMVRQAMEEATEHLVRLHLESQGYVVSTNVKIRLERRISTARGFQKQRTPFEVDLVAVNPKSGDRILGDVKSYFGSRGVGARHFKKLGGRQSRLVKRMKLANDRRLAKRILRELEERYGGSFRIVLYAGKMVKGERTRVVEFLKRRGIEVVHFDDVMGGLVSHIRSQGKTYFNDQVIQTIKILDALKMLKA